MGFYSCALKNPYGEDSSAAHVGVRKLYQAPMFTQRFKHLQQVSLVGSATIAEILEIILQF